MTGWKGFQEERPACRKGGGSRRSQGASSTGQGVSRLLGTLSGCRNKCHSGPGPSSFPLCWH